MEVLLKTVINDWDIWRSEINQDGDSENPRITRKQRKSRELFNAVVEDFKPSKNNQDSRKKVGSWIESISDDAEFNLSSYAECFVSENLLRKYIIEKRIPIPQNVQNKINDWKNRAENAKQMANINFQIREDDSDLSHLDMDNLAYLADDETDRIKKATLRRDATEYKPIRDALAHTSRLTSIAKSRLSITCENIKSRITHLMNKA